MIFDKSSPQEVHTVHKASIQMQHTSILLFNEKAIKPLFVP